MGRLLKALVFLLLIMPGYGSLIYAFDEGTKPGSPHLSAAAGNNKISWRQEPAPDLLYEYRIAQLNTTSPVKLDYNADVKKYIDLYTGKRKSDFARIIGLAELYFPIFDEYLDRYNLPLELKYLTIVESGLNPLATSSSGAAGLWQFLYNTSDLFDLDVNSYTDERRDPYKSTEAACKYLEYLYNTFFDWQLVLSSYNGGPGEVRKAIERNNGETDYWKLSPIIVGTGTKLCPCFYCCNLYDELL
jgi:membrane-bound lytic murein transglycosylase D